MSLTPKFKQQLKAKAHKLKPVVLVGHNGLSKNVMNEIDRALTDRQLIKIRIQTEDRDLKKALFAEICTSHSAEPIQLIGNVATMYRENED